MKKKLYEHSKLILMNNNIIFCKHDNYPSSCKKCKVPKCCINPNVTHGENNCPYKAHAAVSLDMRPRACRALGCMNCSSGQTHYCYICKDNDATHRSLNCPLKSSIYCVQDSQPSRAYVIRSPQVIGINNGLLVTNNPPVVVVGNRHAGHPVFVGVNAVPVRGFPTSNGMFYFE